MNERIVNLPGAFIPMAEARGLQAQSLVIFSGSQFTCLKKYTNRRDHITTLELKKCIHNSYLCYQILSFRSNGKENINCVLSVFYSLGLPDPSVKLRFKIRERNIHAETKRIGSLQREGSGVSPLAKGLQATSCVARDDRDGCSRYRAAKMSRFRDELGWYRE